MESSNPKVEAVMAALYGKGIATSDYNRIYSLVADGLRWREREAAPKDGQIALWRCADYAERQAGRTRYNLNPDALGSYWNGYDKAMKEIAEECRRVAGTPPGCGECYGRGWVKAIRDPNKPDDDSVNRLPCHICDGTGR